MTTMTAGIEVPPRLGDSGPTGRIYRRLGTARTTLSCCDTTFTLAAMGVGAGRGIERARSTARTLERQLDAFDPDSAVSRLNRRGRVENEHVARVVERGLEYYRRTAGRFDIRQGETEHRLKRFLRGEADTVDLTFVEQSVSVAGDVVTAERPVDLNGLAKGYIVDRAAAALRGPGRRGFVDGGGDLSPPTGPVAVEDPGGGRPLRILDTEWSVASSGGYRRTRDGIDHLYDPVEGRLGSRADLVTVVARRDCMEADALATLLATLAPEKALSLAIDWPGIEAFVFADGSLEQTSGFDRHVA